MCSIRAAAATAGSAHCSPSLGSLLLMLRRRRCKTSWHPIPPPRTPFGWTASVLPSCTDPAAGPTGDRLRAPHRSGLHRFDVLRTLPAVLPRTSSTVCQSPVAVSTWTS